MSWPCIWSDIYLPLLSSLPGHSVILSICHSVILYNNFFYACYPHIHTYYLHTHTYYPHNLSISSKRCSVLPSHRRHSSQAFLVGLRLTKKESVSIHVSFHSYTCVPVSVVRTRVSLYILILVPPCQLLALMCLSIFLCVSLCPCRRPAFASPKRSLLAPACLSIPKCVPLLVPTFLPTNGFQNPHSQNHN